MRKFVRPDEDAWGLPKGWPDLAHPPRWRP